MSPRMRNELDLNEVQPYLWVEATLNILLLIGANAWFILGCFFLANDRTKCGGYSKFWIYSTATMFSMILSYLVSLGIYTKDETAVDGIGRFNYLNFSIFLVLEVPLVTYGIFAMWVEDKDNICFQEKYDRDGNGGFSQLYIWALVSWCLRVTYLLLNVIGSIAVLLRKPAKKEIDDSC